MWWLFLSCAKTADPAQVPPAATCQARCEHDNQARAVAWAQVVADCQAACVEPPPAATRYTGVVTRHLSEQGDELRLMLPGGGYVVIADGVDVAVGREATLSADQVVP